MNLEHHLQISERLWRVSNRHFVSNTYLYLLPEGKCFIIDPGLDAEIIEELVTDLDVTPVAVLCTHGHFDHVGTSNHFASKHSIPVYLHFADEKVAKSANFLLMACKIDVRIKLPKFELLRPNADSEVPTLTIEGQKVLYVPIPGHTPGSCGIQIENILFTGDTLYSRGVGLVSLPGEDITLLKQSLHKIFDLYKNQDIFVCPGHGSSDSLKNIAEKNIALKEFLRF